MALTASERLALLDTALDNAYAALAAPTGSAIRFKNAFDPDGGQITFQTLDQLDAYIERLEAHAVRLRSDVAAEAAGVTRRNAIPIVRRST